MAAVEAQVSPSIHPPNIQEIAIKVYNFYFGYRDGDRAAFEEKFFGQHVFEDAKHRGHPPPASVQKPTVEDITALCTAVGDMFKVEPNVVQMHPPTKVVGDIHGQFFDILEMIRVCGPPVIPHGGGLRGEGLRIAGPGQFDLGQQYLFLGDIVDRGNHGLETLLMLMSFKVLNPNTMILRGNHESRGCTETYGFRTELTSKIPNMPDSFYNQILEMFWQFPLAAVINLKNPDGPVPDQFKRVFCCHGGIGPKSCSMAEINIVNRFEEIPKKIGEYDTLSDITWSDPVDEDDPAQKEKLMSGGRVCKFTFNTGRGAGAYFGKLAVEEFCKDNDVEMVVRSHELAHAGFHPYYGARVLTCWGAPNYCYRAGNLAGIVSIGDALFKRQDVATENPKYIFVEGMGSNVRSRSVPRDYNGIILFDDSLKMVKRIGSLSVNPETSQYFL
eukprot:m.15320 g.15320  ORF g.15320 m.15320 type:complete len:443 (+) comp6553_c0_seq2:119-1447(+)